MIRRKPKPFEPRLTCAWCEKPIANDAEVISLSVKIRPEYRLAQDQAGQITNFHLLTTGGVVPVIVAGADSKAKKDRKDLLFPGCSMSCAKALNATLHHEKGLLDPEIG